MDEEDEVVQEVIPQPDLAYAVAPFQFDVAVAASSGLFQLQLPLRSSGSVQPCESRVRSARYRRKVHALEMTVELDTESAAFNRSKAEQIALSCRSSRSDTAATPFPTYSTRSSRWLATLPGCSMMDHAVLAGSLIDCPSARNYAVGMLHNGTLHLSAVEGCMQLRPSFSYMNVTKASGAAADARKTDAGESATESDGAAAETGGQAVRVKFVRQETAAARKRREASAHHRQRVAHDDPWRPLAVFQADAAESSTTRGALLCPAEVAATSPHFAETPSVLIRTALPAPEDDSESSSTQPQGRLSVNRLKQMPLDEQVVCLLKNVKAVRFKQLLALLAPASGDRVLASVERVAWLVQGCWVVKSEVLYPTQGKGAIRNGVPAESLCKARDYALSKLISVGRFSRKDVTEWIRLNEDDLDDILDGLARSRAGRGWQFVFSRDDEFIRDHADVVKRAEVLWSSHQSELQQAANSHKNRQRSGSMKGARRRTVSSRSMSSSSDTADVKPDMAAHTPQYGAPCPHALAMFACSSPRRRRGSGVGPSSSAAALPTTPYGAADETPPESAAAAAAVANGRSAGSDAVAALRQFVFESLSLQRVLSVGDVRRLLHLRRSESTGGGALTAAVADEQIESALQQLGAVPVDVAGQRAFVSVDGGAWPHVRRALARFLPNKNRFRLKTFRAFCAKDVAEMPPEEELLKLLREYCNEKGGLFSLRTST